MRIDTPALAATIARTCTALAPLDAAEGCIGRIGGWRLLLRIEPDREDWAGREIPLPPGAEGILGEDEPVPADAGIRSPFNACCFREACRELLLAVQLILDNPDHELLPTERDTAEAAMARATGEGA